MYDYIPIELQQEVAWVNVWNGSKVPMQARTMKAASSVLPQTWSTFKEAVDAVANGTYDGIGYVFHDTSLVGIDIDAGYDEDGFWSNLSLDIAGHCQSYTEKSRSGRGIHILVRGTLPFKGKNNQHGVEIYRTGRYFITTGQRMVYPNIIENQAAIDYVIQTYFPEEARAAEHPGTGTRIYSPTYAKPEPGAVRITPDYPPIGPGSRNISLTSLAGQMHTQGYTKGDIYRELLSVNQQACEPPLDRAEVEQIVSSVTRYVR